MHVITNLNKIDHRPRRQKRLFDRKNYLDNLKNSVQEDFSLNKMGANVRVPLSLIFDARLTPQEKQIYLILYSIGKEKLGNTDDQSLIAFPSMYKLSQITRLSMSQVR